MTDEEIIQKIKPEIIKMVKQLENIFISECRFRIEETCGTKRCEEFMKTNVQLLRKIAAHQIAYGGVPNKIIVPTSSNDKVGEA